jgi:hypothetical protein
MSEATKGVTDSKGFQPLDASNVKNETSTNIPDSGGTDRLGFRFIPPLINYLQDNFLFTAILLSIVGYIVIASFGGMETLGQYFRYILFLCLAFVVYGIAKLHRIALSLLILAVVVLASIVTFQNRDLITYIFPPAPIAESPSTSVNSVGTSSEMNP